MTGTEIDYSGVQDRLSNQISGIAQTQTSVQRKELFSVLLELLEGCGHLSISQFNRYCSRN